MPEKNEKECKRIDEEISLKSMIPVREKVELDSDDDDFPQYSIPEEEFHLKEVSCCVGHSVSCCTDWPVGFSLLGL